MSGTYLSKWPFTVTTTVLGAAVAVLSAELLWRRTRSGPPRRPESREKKVRPPVVLRDRDRLPPAPPLVRALRPAADPRVDPAVLVRWEPRPSEARSGAAVLVLPGGNYDSCNLKSPMEVASWLTELGVVAYVLRYRLRSEGHVWPAQEDDCKEALNLVRAEASSVNVDPGKVGVIGFSAGGHLATVAATMFPPSLKPNFQILVYASTDVETPPWDPWIARLGYPSREFNTFDKVTKDTPPAFLAVSEEDDVSSFLENTLPYATACDRVGVSAEVVLAKMGQHGHGMKDAWTVPCGKWLARHGWATGPPAAAPSPPATPS